MHMHKVVLSCLIALAVSFPARADQKTDCLIAAYGGYIDAQQQAARDVAALSVKYIPESAVMAESQRNLRLLETEAERTAFAYLARNRQDSIPLQKPIDAWAQNFGIADKTALIMEDKAYADLMEKIVTARAETNKAQQEWRKTESVKTPSALADYQKDLLDTGRTLNAKIREAEGRCGK